MSNYLKLKGVLDIFAKEEDEKEWRHISTNNNLITNVGFNVIGNRLTAAGSAYDNTTFKFFAISNGTGVPAATDTASTFYADGSTFFTKAVESYDYSTTFKRETWNCYLSLWRTQLHQ